MMEAVQVIKRFLPLAKSRDAPTRKIVSMMSRPLFKFFKYAISFGGLLMKITCPYCGSLFNDTEEKCPACGATNKSVRRYTDDQPLTIADLQAWYERHGLPPYETTRFFIGENYTQPRAFGIYYDDARRVFVVYKNKSDGSRAVRYEGSDEAYAVNEIFMRLKQEILQQKAQNLQSVADPESTSARPLSPKKRSRKVRRFSVIALLGFILAAIIFAGNARETGYYRYNEDIYYQDEGYDRFDKVTYDYRYFLFDKDTKTWGSEPKFFLITERSSETDGPAADEVPTPPELKKVRKAKKYFLGSSYKPEFGCTDFNDTLFMKDRTTSLESGYYTYDGVILYYLDRYYLSDTTAWHGYDESDGQWYEIDEKSLPQAFDHPGLVKDFYFTPTWDSSTQFNDFETTPVYESYAEAVKAYDETHASSDDDDDYSWSSSDDSWDSDSTDWDSDW